MPFEYDYYDQQERQQPHERTEQPSSQRNALSEQSLEVFDPRKRQQFDFSQLWGNNGAEGDHKVEADKDGSPLRVTSNGQSRDINYETVNGKKEVSSIIDKHPGPNGEQADKWIRNRNADGTFSDWFTCARNGKVDGRRGVKVNENGDYEFENGDGKREVSKACVQDANDLIIEDKSQRTTDNRAEFREAMEKHLGPKRMERLDQLMDTYENRMSNRAYARKLAGNDADTVDADIKKTIDGTYKELSEMVSENPSTQRFNQATRATLAENFMFHTAKPNTVDQGNNKTCWIESGYIAGGLMNHSDHMARLLKEVTLTGEYTTLNNGEKDPQRYKFKFSQDLLAMGNEEKNWSIDKHAEQPWRSPVSLIFDKTLPVIGGRREHHEGSGGYGDENSGVRKTMYMVTGDTVHDAYHLINNSERQTLLEKGAFITYATIGREGHMRTKQLVNNGGNWLVLQDDQHGEYKDTVTGYVPNIQDWSRQQTVNNPGRTQRRNASR